MPEKRLQNARGTLPAGYQFGQTASLGAPATAAALKPKRDTSNNLGKFLHKKKGK